MKTLFKSRLRKKIESKRVNLLKERMKIQDKKAEIKLSLKPAEYCSLVVEEGKISDDINLLSELLDN